MSGDTEVLTRTAVRTALAVARAAAEAEFDPWWSGYLAGVRGDDLESLLQRLTLHMGRAIRDREQSDVQRGHADGTRDQQECPDGESDECPVR